MALPSANGAGHDAALHLVHAGVAVPLAAGPGLGAVLSGRASTIEIAAIKGVTPAIRETATTGEMREMAGISVTIMMVVTKGMISPVETSATPKVALMVVIGLAVGAHSGVRIVSRKFQSLLLQGYHRHRLKGRS